MGMTNNQLHLVGALAENRIQDAKKYAIACCVEDTTRKNQMYVQRFKAMLENRGHELIELPTNIKGLIQMEDVSGFREERYYLGKKESEIYKNIEETNAVSLRLLELGLPYLNSTLLYGPPGTGKTMFGRYTAYRLGLPFAYVNFSYLIDSYMGNTSKNLHRVFDYCKGIKCVLMLDEIDCIGLKRSEGTGSSAGAELARTTITLMQELDNLTNEQVVIAATNRRDRLDPALLRRFSTEEEFAPFDETERMALACKFLEHIPGITFNRDEVRSYVQTPKTQGEIIKFATRLVIRQITEEVNYSRSKSGACDSLTGSATLPDIRG